MIRELTNGVTRHMGGGKDQLIIIVAGLFLLGVDVHPVLAALYVIAGGGWIGLEAYDEWDLDNW